MKISEKWLREFASPPGDTESLVHQLTMQGLEVEDVEPAAPPLDGVVVGRVVTLAPHPNADRLRVCQVDVGTATVQIVCGAPNVCEDGRYPVALPGVALPGGLVIKTARLCGVESSGMLCSAAELGLADADSGRGEGLLDLEPTAVPGSSVVAVLALDDRILDLKITPNRADCFSVVGVARDLAACTGLAFGEPEVPVVPPADQHAFPVRIEAATDSPVFAVRVIRGLRADAKSPFWLRERLRRSGLRSISPVVDVTNLVMLELGQPMHAYDLDMLRDELIVRRAVKGESLQLLTGATAELDEDMLVIADRDGPVGLAGIMGGQKTAVSTNTTNILLESASFTPAVIAGRARRLGLQTDAATRFERGVDPTGQQRAIERATALLLEIAGGRAGPCSIHAVSSHEPARVQLRRTSLARVLGHAIPDEEVAASLKRLGMRVQPSTDGWQVEAPAFRFDIATEVDLVEEVARVRGYEHIPPRAGRQTTVLGSAPAEQVGLDVLTGCMVQRGYQEVLTYSFVDGELDQLLAGGVRGAALANPLSADLSVMRQSLWPGLLQALRYNRARQQQRVRLFESGIRFLPDGVALSEEPVIAGIAVGPVLPEQWDERTRPADFYDIKGDVEALLSVSGPLAGFEWTAEVHPALHPGRSAFIRREGRAVGWVGVLHPTLVQSLSLDEAPILFELRLDELTRAPARSHRGLSRFPVVRRDLAVVVSRVMPVQRLVGAVREAAGPVLRDVVVFDVYAGEHIDATEKSVALGLILQETSRTLTDAETDKIIGGVIQRLGTDLNARIRE